MSVLTLNMYLAPLVRFSYVILALCTNVLVLMLVAGSYATIKYFCENKILQFVDMQQLDVLKEENYVWHSSVKL